MTSKHIFLFLAIAFLWSIQWVLLKGAMTYIPPFLLLGMRNAIASAVILIVITRFASGHYLRIQSKYLIAVSIMYTLENIFWISGLNILSAGESSILFYSYPLIVAVFSYLVFGETLSPIRLIGVVSGFLGVALFFVGSFNEFSFNIVGYILTLMAASCWALNLVFSTKWARDVTPWMLAFVNFSMSASFMLFFSAWTEKVSPVTALRTEVFLPLLFSSIGDLLALTAWFKLTRHWKPTRIATYSFLIPLLTVVFSWTLLNQPLSSIGIMAMLAIIIGIVLVNPPQFNVRPEE